MVNEFHYASFDETVCYGFFSRSGYSKFKGGCGSAIVYIIIDEGISLVPT